MIKRVKRAIFVIVCAVGIYNIFPAMAAEASTIDLQAGWLTPVNLNGSSITIPATINPDNWPQPSFASDDTGLYAAWVEQNGTYTKVRIKKNDGSGWNKSESEIDGGGLSLNGFFAADPFLTIYNGVLYCAWREQYIEANTTQYGLYLMRYNGDKTWTRVDDGKTRHGDKYESDSGLCFSSSADVDNVCIVAHDGYLYVAWDEKYTNKNMYEIHVRRYNGTAWEAIDGGKVEGINVDPSNSASSPHLTFYDDVLYAAWLEKNNSSSVSQLVIKKYQLNSSTGAYEWVLAGGSKAGSIVKGINGSSSAGNPKLCIMNDKIYAVWTERTYVYTSSYDTTAGWSTPVKLTASMVSAGRFDITVYQNCMYVVYLLLFDKKINTYVLKYDGSNITNLTDTINGYISTGTLYGSNSPVIEGYNHTLTVAWVEGTASGYNIVSRTAAIPYISISNAGIEQGKEDGSIITVTLTGGSFRSTLNADNWTVANLPDGVTKGSVARADDHTVNIALLGNSTTYMNTDITDVKVSCTADEYTKPIDGKLTANTGVTIKAKTCNVTVAQTGSGSVELNSTLLTTNPYDVEFTLGNSVTLSASAGAGYHFAYWTDIVSGSIISTKSNYSFITGTDLNLTAVFQQDLADSYYVLIRDPNGRILSTQTVKSGDNAIAPPAPYIIGYEFIGWDKSLRNITSDKTITAQFKRLTTTYRLTVTGGTISDTGNTEGDYKYDTSVTIVADTAPSGQQFAYWSLNDVIVSRSATYSFYMSMNAMMLKAVYESMSTSTVGDPLIALFPNVTLGTDGQSMLFIANRDVIPAGSTLIESGILLYQGSLSGDLALDTTGVVIVKVKNTSTKQFYVRKSGISSGDIWYARAYMIYQNTATGKIMIVYSANTVCDTMS